MADEVGVGGRDAGIWESTRLPSPLLAAGVGARAQRVGCVSLGLR